MRTDIRGFSIIECLVALTVLSIGALGAAATGAYALRTVGEGNRAVRAARLLSAQMGQLRLKVRLAGGSCLALGGGQVSGTGGEQLVWLVSPAPGGQQLTLVVSFATARGQHTDTTPGFLACR